MLTNSLTVLIDFHSMSSGFSFLFDSKLINLNFGASMLLGSYFLLKSGISPMGFLMSFKKRTWRLSDLKVKTFDSEFILKLGSWKADIHVTKNK